MDPLRARNLAEMLLPRPDQTLDAADGHIDPAAIPAIDMDGDAHISRDELTRGLEQDLVTVDVSGTTVIEANTVAFPETSGPLGPNGRSPEVPWFQGGSSAVAPSANLAQPQSTLAMAAPLSVEQLHNLQGSPFTETAQVVRTPQQVAYFLGLAIAYDQVRADTSAGPANTYAASETLQRREGVCRDHHALGRDLLLANGIRAETVGYQSTNHGHAVTAYQDPASGFWGIIEYGTIYPPSDVQANSSEEAVARIRPNALAISRYTSDGPDARSDSGLLAYQPLHRAYESFMAGPPPGSGTGVQLDRSGISLMAAGPEGSHLRAQVTLSNDPTLPQLSGAMMGGVWQDLPSRTGYVRLGAGGGVSPGATSFEVGSNAASANPLGHAFLHVAERHPALWRQPDVLGLGITANLSSRSTLNLMGLGALAGEDVTRGRFMLSRVTTNPEVSVSRSFAIGREQPNLQVRLATGLGLDALQAVRVAAGVAGSPPISSYATATVNARPLPWLGVQVNGFVPFTNATNDFLAMPAMQATVATPVATLFTTQSGERALYSAQVGTTVAGTQVTAYATLDEDRRTQRTSGNLGIQASVATW
jgi:hypothetical protein